jgi:hypothetical protein
VPSSRINLVGPQPVDLFWVAKYLTCPQLASELALKGPYGTARIVFRSQLWHFRPWSPFRAKSVFLSNPG